MPSYEKMGYHKIILIIFYKLLNLNKLITEAKCVTLWWLAVYLKGYKIVYIRIIFNKNFLFWGGDLGHTYVIL